jgi:hypothetical protein
MRDDDVCDDDVYDVDVCDDDVCDDDVCDDDVCDDDVCDDDEHESDEYDSDYYNDIDNWRDVLEEEGWRQYESRMDFHWHSDDVHSKLAVIVDQMEDLYEWFSLQ